jgi:hypothetical protein
VKSKQGSLALHPQICLGAEKKENLKELRLQRLFDQCEDLSARAFLSFFISIESQKAGLLILKIRITLEEKRHI